MARTSERRSFALVRRVTTPCSTSFANLRRTVVDEPRFRRNSCFGASGCFCSSAYPISMMISKSMRDFRNVSSSRSNSLSFLSAANNFMFACRVFLFFKLKDIKYSEAQPHRWQAKLRSILAPKQLSPNARNRRVGPGAESAFAGPPQGRSRAPPARRRFRPRSAAGIA